MQPSLKAVLLSGLVFPGVGQMSIKRHFVGAGFIAMAGVGLVLVLIQAYQQATAAADRLLIQIAQGAPFTLEQVLAEARVEVEGQALWGQVGVWLLGLSWVGSMVHGYWAGRKREHKVE